jgi:hypothetical protein
MRDGDRCFWCHGPWGDGWEHDFCDVGNLRPWEPVEPLRMRTSKRERAARRASELAELACGRRTTPGDE